MQLVSRYHNCVFMALYAVKPKHRKVRFTEHEKILQTTLESYIGRVCIVSMLADEIRLRIPLPR